MNKEYDNEIFGFSNEDENVTDFNLNNVEGLGESNYENEDLFKTEDKSDLNQVNNGFNYGISEETQTNNENVSFTESTTPELADLNNTKTISEDADINLNQDIKEEPPIFDIPFSINNGIPQEKEIEEVKEPSNGMEETLPLIEKDIPEVKETEETTNSNDLEDPLNDVLPLSNDLENITEFKEDNIESTDINSLFDKVNNNVTEATEIFKRNTEMKKIIDSRFEELKTLQLSLEKSKKNQMVEIDTYRDSVLDKLAEKKEEIEKRLNVLKDLQASLEKDKKEFEEYKRNEQDKIKSIERDVQSAYDARKNELSQIEDKLRQQKDSLDDERNQLSMDKIKYETDKNDLANNLLKFNELVDSFTNGVDSIEEE